MDKVTECVLIGNMQKRNIQLWDNFGGFVWIFWVRSPVQAGTAKEQDEGRDGFHT